MRIETKDDFFARPLSDEMAIEKVKKNMNWSLIGC